MTLVHYMAEVKNGLLLELPAEAHTLHLKPGDKVQVQLDAGLHSATDQSESAPALDAKAKAALALLDSWIAEGEAADEQTRQEATQEVEEFKRNMNANRATTEERLIYP